MRYKSISSIGWGVATFLTALVLFFLTGDAVSFFPYVVVAVPFWLVMPLALFMMPPIWTVVSFALISLFVILIKRNWALISSKLKAHTLSIQLLLAGCFCLTVTVFWLLGRMTPVFFLKYEMIFWLICFFLALSACVSLIFFVRRHFHSHKPICLLLPLLLLECLIVSQALVMKTVISPTYKVRESVSPYNPHYKAVHYSRQADMFDDPAGPCFYTLERSWHLPYLIYEGPDFGSKLCGFSIWNEKIHWVDPQSIKIDGHILKLPVLPEAGKRH